MADNNINVGVVFEAVNNATGVINQLKTEIAGLQNAVNINTSGLSNLSNQLNNVRNSARGAGEAASGGKSGFESMLSSFNRISASAFILFETTKHVAEAIYDLVGSAQRLQMQMIAMAGGVTQAHQQINTLRQLSNDAEIPLENLSNGFSQLRLAGLSVQEANAVLRGTAAAALATGQGAASIDRTTQAISLMATRGTASGREFSSLLRGMPGVLQAMAEHAHMSMASYEQAIAEGLRSSSQVIADFAAGSNAKFSPFLTLMHDTLPGAVGDLGAVFQEEIEKITGAGLGDWLTAMIQDITSFVREIFHFAEVNHIFENFQFILELVNDVWRVFVNTWQQLAPIIVPIARLIGDVIHLLVSLYTAYINWVEGMQRSNPILRAVGDTLKTLGDFIGWIADGIENLTRNLDRMNSQNANRMGTFNGQGIGGTPSLGPTADHVARVRANREAAEGLAGTLSPTGGTPPGFNAAGESVAQRIARYANEIHSQFVSGGAQFVQQLFEAQTKMQQIARIHFDAITQAREAIAALNAGQTPEEIGASGGSSRRAQMVAEQTAIFARAYQQWNTTLTNSLLETQQKIDEAMGRVGGSTAEAAAERVRHQWEGVLATLQQELTQAQAVDAVTHNQSDTIQRINDEIAAINQNMGAWEAHARRVQIYQEQIARDTAATELADARRAQVLQGITQSTSIIQQMLSGTAGADLYRQSVEAQSQLADEIIQLEQKMFAAQEAAISGPVEMREAARQTAQIYAQMIAADQAAMNRMSSSAIASRKLWSDVGKTISDSVGNAIYGLVTGTQTLRDVGVQAFQAITRACADYIVQLIEAQIQQMILNSLKAAGGFFADGGVVPGGSKMIPKFADGGVSMNGLVHGPTLFMAGEAGSEAIMPLTRIGGKLGVRSAGGGGDNYTINIHAVDTQSGAEFLMKNMDHIVNGLRSRTSRNAGVERYRP